MNRAWLGVVSRSHVWRGMEGGFAQVCHGKKEPLRRMSKGDIFVYYSPNIEVQGAPLKAFTAIGKIEDDEVFEFDMGAGFVPFRRRVRYAKAKEVALDLVRGELDLCVPPNWGIVLRRGLIPLTDKDTCTIACAMGVDLLALRRN
ncbi:EVE domain-containing protein [Pseudomonas mediterranea]|uniref:EVE domain-containing protein n=1 Tax=Pseudomonas mediterranea TaxID=183795 RepID=UPI0006D892FF|nr:EVE domain-containing protein [Pseudomonas mediterranea]